MPLASAFPFFHLFLCAWSVSCLCEQASMALSPFGAIPFGEVGLLGRLTMVFLESWFKSWAIGKVMLIKFTWNFRFHPRCLLQKDLFRAYLLLSLVARRTAFIMCYTLLFLFLLFLCVFFSLLSFWLVLACLAVWGTFPLIISSIAFQDRSPDFWLRTWQCLGRCFFT